MESIKELRASGSSRKYYRIQDGDRSRIKVAGTDALENRAFITLARHFKDKGINVPEIYEVSGDMMSYEQEDLGDESLYQFVSSGRASGTYSEAEQKMLCKTIAQLPKIQYIGAQDLDYEMCFPDREFNERMVDFDLNYFKYCFLKTSGINFNEIRLQDDFDTLKHDLMDDIGNTFMYRDFQARNVIIKDGEPWFIDFQGGRRGPVYYDVASFVWQASARYPSELKEKLVDTYYNALCAYENIDRRFFNRKLRIFVLFRTLQVLGAYGFRGRFEKKPYFISSIPFALDNVRELLETPFGEYPYLCEILAELCREKTGTAGEKGTLEVVVQSFSYRAGVPADESGNGGGYVFDCRSIHNPGRYPEYQHLCGKDKEVIDFLETRSNVAEYLGNVFALVDNHVATYLERSFTHLQISFGCTGGQHRSVYCAEKTAAHLKEKFAEARIILKHTALPE